MNGPRIWHHALVLMMWVIGVRATHAQNVLIGPDDVAPHASALLHLDVSPFSTNAKKGVLPPNVALTRTDQPGPVGPLPLPPSLLVYNTATTSLTGTNAQYNVYPGFYFWDNAGARWLRFEAGVGRHVYMNCTSASFSVPYQASWVTTAGAVSPAAGGAVHYIPGLWSNANLLSLQAGDRVFLEASGAFRLADGTVDTDRYTDVEVELVYNTGGGTAWTVAGSVPLARAVVSLDTRVVSASSNSFFFGLFSSSSSGFAQRAAIQNWSLTAFFDVPSTNANYKFWVRARKLRNVGGAAGVTTGTPGAELEGCLRTEVFRY